jgi:hypothetical protein
MEWKPKYGVYMDEAYKLTYPDGQFPRLLCRTVCCVTQAAVSPKLLSHTGYRVPHD